MLLLLHGTGGNENDMIQVGRELAPGASMLSPRGKVLENGMPRFFRRLAEGVFDIEDLKFRTGELADFVEAAADHYGFDLRRLVAVGYSNGANIAASLLLLRPRVLQGGVLFRPMVPLVPVEEPNLDGKQLYISAGTSDPLTPKEETEKLVKMLESYGARIVLKWVRAGHALSPVDVQEARGWVRDTFQ